MPLPGRTWWVAVALVVATAFAYVPALRAPFLLDDWVTIEAAARLRAAEGMPTRGRPMVMATLAANYQVNRVLGVDQRPDPAGPDKTIGYRLFNLLLHLSTGALLFAVLRRAMRERAIPEDWRAIADPLAGIVTALWLLHPIQSEVINYVVQRSEAQASLCYLATLYGSQRAWDAAPASRTRWYALAVVSCALGMMSKEIVITAPLAVMLYDRAFRLRSWNALWAPGGGRGWAYLAMWCVCLATFAIFQAGSRGDAAAFGIDMPWYRYFYTQCWAIAHYLRLVVWPTALAPDYGFRPIAGARGVPGLVLLTAFGALTLGAWRRVERFGWFAFAGSMFFVLLAPSSSVVPVPLEIAAERRIYLALAAVLVLAVVGAEWIRRRFAPRLAPRWLLAGGTGVAIVLSVVTAGRSRLYGDPESLWRKAAAAVPDNSRALEQLGLVLFAQGPPAYARAESAFVKALAMDSSCQSGCLQYAALLSKEGRYAQAVPLLERQAAERGGTMYDVLATKLLSLDWMRLGNYDRAVPYLERLVQLDPTVSHFVALGVSYLTVGRRDEAIATFRHMATLDPSNERLQSLSARLEDGTNHPEALSNLQDFAATMMTREGP
jgi:Tfp pilus assembly protein PilF